MVSSRIVENTEDESRIVNIFNVFLELFGSFEIVEPDLSKAVQVRRVNWRILPEGEYPFERARDALDDYIKKLPPDDQPVITERIRAITRHVPDFVAVGEGGFSD